MFLLNKQFDIKLLSNNDDCYNRHLLSLNCQSYIANDERVYTTFLEDYYNSVYLDKYETYYNSCAIFEKDNENLIIHEYSSSQYYDVEEIKSINEIKLNKSKNFNCFGKAFINILERYTQFLDIEDYQYHLFINI